MSTHSLILLPSAMPASCAPRYISEVYTAEVTPEVSSEILIEVKFTYVSSESLIEVKFIYASSNDSVLAKYILVVWFPSMSGKLKSIKSIPTSSTIYSASPLSLKNVLIYRLTFSNSACCYLSLSLNYIAFFSLLALIS